MGEWTRDMAADEATARQLQEYFPPSEDGTRGTPVVLQYINRVRELEAENALLRERLSIFAPETLDVFQALMTKLRQDKHERGVKAAAMRKSQPAADALQPDTEGPGDG